MIRDLLTWAAVATVGQDEALEALGYGITDYEDALIAAAASASGMDWLVTRDEAGFLKGPVPPITPGDFLVGNLCFLAHPLNFNPQELVAGPAGCSWCFVRLLRFSPALHALRAS